MSLLLYGLTAALALLAADRWVGRVSRAAAIVLVLLPFCFVGLALLTDGVYGPIDIAYATEPLMGLRDEYRIPAQTNGVLGDLAYQMIPWRKAVQWAISHGEWPLWNPFLLSGDILAAAGQPAAYSPFTLIALLLPIGKGLTYSAAIAFFLAAAGSYLFARSIGCGETASLIASAGFMYSTAISLFILWPLGFSWALFPLVLLGGRLVVHEPSVRAGSVLFAGLSLLLPAGHPESVLHVVTAAAAYCVMELVAVRRQARRAMAAAAVAGIAALLVSAIYLLPLLEAAGQTMEHAFRAGDFGEIPRGAPVAAVLAHLATALFPFAHLREWRVEGVPAFSPESAAVGSIVLALAAYAVVRGRSRQTWFFAGMVLFGLLAGATWTPIARLLQRLPLFDIAINERFLFAAAFALSVLAAIGADRILRTGTSRDAAVVFGVVLVVLSAGTFLLLHLELVGPNQRSWGDYKTAAELVALLIAVALIAFRTPPRVLGPALLGLLLIQRTASESGVYPVYPERASYPPIPLLEPLKSVRDPFRVVGYNLAFIPGTSTLYELEDPRGYQAMTFTPYFELYPLWSLHQPVWFNKVIDLTSPFLSFLNVRFAVQSRNYEVPEGWRVVREAEDSRLVENTRVIERVFLPRTLRVGFTPSEARLKMAEVADFRDVAWIAAEGAPYERKNGTGRLTTARSGSRYVVDAEMEDDGWIVVSEKAWKGWRAYIDGRRVETTVANTAFVSVFVPRGEHRVLLVYLPESFVLGRAISLSTIAVIVVFATLFAYRRRRAVSHPA